MHARCHAEYSECLYVRLRAESLSSQHIREVTQNIDPRILEHDLEC